jgi:hypothetical protein
MEKKNKIKKKKEKVKDVIVIITALSNQKRPARSNLL